MESELLGQGIALLVRLRVTEDLDIACGCVESLGRKKASRLCCLYALVASEISRPTDRASALPSQLPLWRMATRRFLLLNLTTMVRTQAGRPLTCASNGK